MSDSKSLKEILSSKFLSHGSESSATMLFDHLSDDARTRMVQLVPLEDDELPVVGSIISNDNWLLITTERVIGVDHGDVHVIRADDIRKVIMEPFWKVNTLAPPERMNTDVLERMKLQATEIKLVTSSGAEYFVRAEPGKPYIGIVNVMIQLSHRGRPGAKKP